MNIVKGKIESRLRVGILLLRISNLSVAHALRTPGGQTPVVFEWGTHSSMCLIGGSLGFSAHVAGFLCSHVFYELGY